VSTVIGIVIAVLVLLAIAVTLTVTKRRRGGPLATPPGTHHPGLINPVHGPSPAEPGFRVHPEPGFTIVSRSDNGWPGPRDNTGPRKPITPGTGGFMNAGVTQNLTAICRLTGAPAGECTCEKHLNQHRGKR
jgi:hypothetical protein